MDWGQSELPSPVVRDDEVTVAARRRKKVAFPSPGGSPIAPSLTPRRPLLRNTPASLFRQAVTPRVPDVSSILVPGVRTPRYTHTPRHALSSANLEDSDWTNSLYVSPVSGLDGSSFFRDDEANLSSALLKEDDPGEAAAASLFPEFLASFLKHSSCAVFELLEDYQNISQEKALRNFEEGGRNPTSSSDIVSPQLHSSPHHYSSFTQTLEAEMYFNSSDQDLTMLCAGGAHGKCSQKSSKAETSLVLL